MKRTYERAGGVLARVGMAAMMAGVAACEGSDVAVVVENPVPILVTLDPPVIEGGAAAALTLNVIGLGFVPDADVRWNGQPRPTLFLDPSHLTVSLDPADLAATGHVDVVNPGPGGGISEPLPLTVNERTPTLAAVTPTSAVALSTTNLTVQARGTRFVGGPTGTVLVWDGLELPTVVESDTTLRANVPDYLLHDGRSVAVSVKNRRPGSAPSAMLPFAVNNPVPVITSMNPGEVDLWVGGYLELFAQWVTHDVSIAVGDSLLEPTFWSASEIETYVAGHVVGTTGTVEVRLVNPGPGGGASNPILLSVRPAQPNLGYLQPSQILAGSPDLQLVLRGHRFDLGATVTWNGEPRAATVAYDTRIDLPVSASDVAAPGLISIGVTNPGGAPESVADLVVVPSHAHSAWLVYEHWGSGSVTASRVDGSGSVTVAGGATRVDASPVAFKAVYHWDDRIHEVDFLTGQTRRVTPVGIPLQTESWARYSTDGAWVYFVGQPSHGRSEIWRARLDGSVAERVIGDPSASLSSPSLSRDGTRIVYARTESGAGPLWIHDIASSTSTPLGTDGQMSRWSPTDDYIVYLTDNWSLRVIEPDGSGDRNLLNVVNVGHAFDFAPDGMSIVGTTQGGEPIRISFPGGIATPLVGIPQIGSIAAFAP